MDLEGFCDLRFCPAFLEEQTMVCVESDKHKYMNFFYFSAAIPVRVCVSIYDSAEEALEQRGGRSNERWY